MDKSILDTIKKLLGISTEDTAFDPDIIALTNNALLAVRQLGVGPENGFMITSNNEIWSDFLDDENLLGAVQMYVYAKVRIVFDPPSSSILSALQESMRETEWRLNVQVDPGNSSSGDSDSDSSKCCCRDYTTDKETIEMLKEVFDN